jgi:hypothetical protein
LEKPISDQPPTNQVLKPGYQIIKPAECGLILSHVRKTMADELAEMIRKTIVFWTLKFEKKLDLKRYLLWKLSTRRTERFCATQ